MINWSQVNELREEVGAEDFEEVVAIFLEEVQEVVDELQGKRPDAGQLESKMHFLKGSALNLGFDAFSALCASGEKSAAAGDGDAVDIGAVLDCYSASRTVFFSELPARLA